MNLLCKINSIVLVYTQQELIELGLAVANGNKNEEEIFEWIVSYKKLNEMI